MTDYFQDQHRRDCRSADQERPSARIRRSERLNDGIQLCLSLNDAGSRELAEKILSDEEHHIDWLEAQLHAIARWAFRLFGAATQGDE